MSPEQRPRYRDIHAPRERNLRSQTFVYAGEQVPQLFQPGRTVIMVKPELSYRSLLQPNSFENLRHQLRAVTTASTSKVHCRINPDSPPIGRLFDSPR